MEGDLWLMLIQKRRRREYRQQRRAAFTRPEPGFGIYEGRTRGKRMRYTYEDDEDGFGGNDSDGTSTRRSTRQQSNRSTPFEAGPTYTASGRQIKQPRQGEYGESLLKTNVMNTDELGPDYSDDVDRDRSVRSGTADSEPPRAGGRATRNAGRPAVNGVGNSGKRKHIDGYNDIDEMSDEEDAADSADEWNSDKNEDDRDEEMKDADDADSESNDSEDDATASGASRSLVVKLKVSQKTIHSAKDTPPTSPPSPNEQDEPQCPGPLEQASTSTTASLLVPAKPEPAPIEAKQEPAPVIGATDHANGVLPSVAERAIPATKLPLSPQVVVPYGEAHRTQYPTPVTTQNGILDTKSEMSATRVAETS